MKYLALFSVLILSILSTLSLTAQQTAFAPIGATWYYGNPGADCMSDNFCGDCAYTKVEYIGDTLVLGKNARLLRFSSFSDVDSVYYKIFYSDTDKVYYLDDSAFHMLYDFAAQPGDTMINRSIYLPQYNISIDVIIVVDSTGYTEISGQQLRTIYTSPKGASGLYFHAPIIERMGNIGGRMMFPTSDPGISVYCIDYIFRCYQDNLVNYKTYNHICDYRYGISSVKETIDKREINLNPNPAANAINISLNNYQEPYMSSLMIYDMSGRLVIQEELVLDEDHQTIGLQNLEPGIYTYQLLVEGNSQVLASDKFTIVR